MRDEQDFINTTASDIDHYHYFTRVVKAASKEILALATSRNIVIDRYWITTVVYHRAMGVPAVLEDMGEIIMPDITVYLMVSPEIQAQRMAKRGMSAGDKRMDGRQYLIRKVYDEVLATQENVVRISTDDLTPDEVVELILAKCP
jgi:thymidylate kinase